VHEAHQSQLAAAFALLDYLFWTGSKQTKNSKKTLKILHLRAEANRRRWPFAKSKDQKWSGQRRPSLHFPHMVCALFSSFRFTAVTATIFSNFPSPPLFFTVCFVHLSPPLRPSVDFFLAKGENFLPVAPCVLLLSCVIHKAPRVGGDAHVFLCSYVSSGMVTGYLRPSSVRLWTYF